MSALSFAKLVATPTETSWSQVYNAGNLFGVLSLSKLDAEETSLSEVGKSIFSNLQAEFFTLDSKTLESIKEAVQKSIDGVPENILVNFCLAFFKENVLYLFVAGGGKVVIKRKGKVGNLIETASTERTVHSASGYLQNADTIVLQTPQFAKDMPEETISSALELNLPNDIAEALSPAMHEKDDGGQAGIIINYKDFQHLSDNEQLEEEQEEVDIQENQLNSDENVEEETAVHLENEETIITPDLISDEKEEVDFVINQHHEEPESGDNFKPSGKSFFSSIIESIKMPFFKKKNNIHFNHRKKLFLTIAAIILIILVASVFFTKKRESDVKTATLFASIYEPALDNYEDGKAVQSINKEFARDDFLKAQKQLHDGRDKFKKGSEEEKKILDLLAKVDSELGGSGGTTTKITPKEISLGSNSFLGIVKANADGKAFTRDQNGSYLLTQKAVVSVSSAGSKKDLIENDEDWVKPSGLSTYQGNFYVLDQENGVLKFTAGSGGFGKSSYFKTKPGNISTATAIAIDGSVWILFKDGTIMKYTRGESDGFKTKGLDKPFSAPSKIFTNLDTENIYILDNGNSRIVTLDKDGNFENQYTADVLKFAKEFEVSEKDGKATVLSNGKFWEIGF